MSNELGIPTVPSAKYIPPQGSHHVLSGSVGLGNRAATFRNGASTVTALDVRRAGEGRARGIWPIRASFFHFSRASQSLESCDAASAATTTVFDLADSASIVRGNNCWQVTLQLSRALIV